MSKADYIVPIVKQGYRALWVEYFEEDIPSQEAKTAQANGYFRTWSGSADSKAHAAQKAESDNPGFFAVSESIQRLAR